ncbi:MAG: YnbE family lipoprotein [Sphingosinicella sp.]
MSTIARALCAGFMLAGLGGCVQVSAPDRPIVIDLNINIRQEVVVRLRDDARELIESERGVF